MSKPNDNRKHIMLRYLFIITLIMLFAIKIIINLIDTTIISAGEWNKRAMEELSKVDSILPERGNILACDGSILATNLRYYTVRIDYGSEQFQADSLRFYAQEVADSLARRFPYRNAEQWKSHLLSPLNKQKLPRAHRLATNLKFDDVQWIKSLPFFNNGKTRRNRSGLVVENYMRRANPYGDMAARSVGRVGANKSKPGIHGISGLEMALDSLLYGKVGYFKKIPLTKGIVNWTDIPAVPGYDIKTTIDINIQDIVENELNDVLEFCDADWGVAVLMDVETGDIKAISNLEKDPKSTRYIEGINRAVQGYEPGSVVKVLSMMIALEDGIVDNLDEVITTGSRFPYAGGKAISDAHPCESMTVGEVIERSSNIGMTRIITRKYNSDPGAFYSRVKSLGFLKPMNMGIAGERTPRFDSVPATNGGRIAMSRMCYGYATEIPPIYTLSLYNAIANGGKFVKPRLVDEIIGEDFDSVMPVTYMNSNPQVCSPVNAAKLRKMLKNVVFGAHGTARRLKSDIVPIAGKTGTCYMIEKATGGYNQGRKRLTFCGFFPADKPKYSCIVLTANPKRNAMGAASTSGEVVKGIALKLYSRGLLGNSSDYTAVKNPGTRPTLYATNFDKRNEQIRDRLTIGASSVMRRPTSNGGVPDVTGMGLREAIAILESSGYNVTFTGAGYVYHQTPAAGTKLKTGEKVNLSLHN
ncbi:MAG: transpeptidase family protein [Muribaculaceae bacterium]|nr:transpeptidase family protein [Muribaculaceae bacterium]